MKDQFLIDNLIDRNCKRKHKTEHGIEKLSKSIGRDNVLVGNRNDGNTWTSRNHVKAYTGHEQIVGKGVASRESNIRSSENQKWYLT